MKTYKVESKKGLYYRDYFVKYYTEYDYNRLVREKIELWFSDLFTVTII